MKIQMVFVTVLALLLTACSPSPPRAAYPEAFSDDFEEYVVLLEVKDGKLAIISEPQGDDARGRKNGWVGFAKGKFGTITFAMKDYETKTACTNEPATRAEWVLTKLMLTTWEDANTEKGEKFGSRQKGWLRKAFPTLNNDYGVAVNEGITTAQTSTVLLNANNNNGQQTAYYEITASRCDGVGDPLVTDPAIRNGGR
jgi:hypothetical protein